MTWGISTGRQRLRNEEGSLEAVRDPGRPLPQKPGWSPFPLWGLPLPAGLGSPAFPPLPGRLVTRALRAAAGCFRAQTPSESPGFLLGWANAMHSWVVEGGGPSAPRSLPVGPGGWLHRGFSSCAGSVCGSRVHPPPWSVQGEH